MRSRTRFGAAGTLSALYIYGRKPVSTPVALVLGGHGLLGQPLAQQLAGNGWEAQSLDFEDCNLLNPVELQPRIEFINPDVILQYRKLEHGKPC